MRMNKIVQGLAVALPIMLLTACGSTSSSSDQASTVDSNATQVENQQSTDTVQVTAAQRAAQIEEERKQQQAMLQQQSTIYFDFDKSSIAPEYTDILDQHAKFLSANPNVKVLIEGHTDERGTPEYNIALGERRAKSVQSYLENMGVLPSQISIVSYGEEKPVDTSRTEAAFAKNRRAVLVY